MSEYVWTTIWLVTIQYKSFKKETYGDLFIS